MKAYLYKAPKALHANGKKYHLLIGKNDLEITQVLLVKGKKEANQLAREYNAQPWNF